MSWRDQPRHPRGSSEGGQWRDWVSKISGRIDQKRSVKFEQGRGRTYEAKKTPKHARVVEAPAGQETVITPEWGGEQRFMGTWVEVLDADGNRAYGSAYDEWVDMHQRIEGEQDKWQKVAPVTAYRHQGESRPLVTVLADGTVETTNTANNGDWLVRQRNGEIQVIRDEKFRKLYEVGGMADAYEDMQAHWNR